MSKREGARVNHGVIATALVAAVALSSCGDGRAHSVSSSAAVRQSTSTRTGRLVFHRLGRLPVPLQLPAAVPGAAGRVLVLGGLSAADTSTDGIVLIRPSGLARVVGHLPGPLHDAAAASAHGHAYLFGGGNLSSGSAVLRVSNGGRTRPAGDLPTGASDLAAAAVGATAYVVGGYTGSVSLRSIVAFSPGHRARRVATLPRPLRYAAVAAVAGKILIAGGTSGTSAQRAVLRFDPGNRRLTRIATLPRPLTHAAGAVLRGRLYVIGGRGNAVDSASSAVWSVGAAGGRVRHAGRLPTALSDVGAASMPRSIVVMGGRDAAGGVHDGILSARLAP